MHQLNNKANFSFLSGKAHASFITLLQCPWGNEIKTARLHFYKAKKRREKCLCFCFSGNVPQLTEVWLLSELPAKPLHGFSEDGLGLRVARPLLLPTHTWHGVHHAHLSSGSCESKAPNKTRRSWDKCKAVFSVVFSKCLRCQIKSMCLIIVRCLQIIWRLFIFSK